MMNNSPDRPLVFRVLAAVCDLKLKPSDRLLLVYLAYRQGRNGKTWPAVRTIAEDLGLSTATVQDSVKRLHEAGVVEKSSGRGCHANMYVVRPVECVSPRHISGSRNVPVPDTKCISLRHKNVSVSDTESLKNPSLGAQPFPASSAQGEIQTQGKIRRKPRSKESSRCRTREPGTGPEIPSGTATVFARWNAHAGRSVEKQGKTITWKGHKLRPDGSLSPEIDTAVRRCLDAGYSVEDICAAIDNYATILLGPEYFWSYPWPLATFLTVADGRGKAGIPKWTKFLPDNFIRETYLAKHPVTDPGADQDIARLAGCEPADEDDAQRLYQEFGLTEA